MRCRAYTSWIAALCILSFFVTSSTPTKSTSCAPVPNTDTVVGGICTAEFLQVATIWTHGEDQAATYQRLFLLLVAPLALAILPIIRTTLNCITTRFVHRARELRSTRAGPSPYGVFLPTLAATHGN